MGLNVDGDDSQVDALDDYMLGSDHVLQPPAGSDSHLGSTLQANTRNSRLNHIIDEIIAEESQLCAPVGEGSGLSHSFEDWQPVGMIDKQIDPITSGDDFSECASTSILVDHGCRKFDLNVSASDTAMSGEEYLRLILSPSAFDLGTDFCTSGKESSTNTDNGVDISIDSEDSSVPRDHLNEAATAGFSAKDSTMNCESSDVDQPLNIETQSASEGDQALNQRRSSELHQSLNPMLFELDQQPNPSSKPEQPPKCHVSKLNQPVKSESSSLQQVCNATVLNQPDEFVFNHSEICDLESDFGSSLSTATEAMERTFCKIGKCTRSTAGSLTSSTSTSIHGVAKKPDREFEWRSPTSRARTSSNSQVAAAYPPRSSRISGKYLNRVRGCQSGAKNSRWDLTWDEGSQV